MTDADKEMDTAIMVHTPEPDPRALSEHESSQNIMPENVTAHTPLLGTDSTHVRPVVSTVVTHSGAGVKVTD